MFKKTIIAICILLCLYTQVYALSAESAIVIDATNGRVLFQKNAHAKTGIASTTKIMTAIVALENSNLSDIVTVSKNASSTEGSSLYLIHNEKITMENLLYGLMLNSGNDAATAIAEHISGSTDKFASLMNSKAQKLNMKNSSFTNPHGLDNPKHYSTAYDLALLTKYAMENEKFALIVNTKQKNIKINNQEKYRYLNNHNKLLNLYPYCTGVKTGYTKQCGRCLVSYAEKDGLKLIVVTLNAPDDWNDHINLYNNFFNSHKLYKIVNKSDYICSTKVYNASETILKLYSYKDIHLTLSKDEYKNLIIEYVLSDNIKAPIYNGQTLGIIYVKSNDEILSSSPLITTYGICENNSINFIDNFNYVITNLFSLFYKTI